MDNALSWVMALSWVLPLLLPLVVFVVVRRQWRKVLPVLNEQPVIRINFWRVLFGHGLARLIAAAFCGLMLTTVGGVAFYPELLRVSEPLICQEGVITVESHHYSYKPGQHGVSRNWFCEQTDAKTEVTGRAIVVTSAMFAVAFWLLFTLLAVIKRRPADTTAEPSVSDAPASDVTAILGRTLDKDSLNTFRQMAEQLKTQRQQKTQNSTHVAYTTQINGRTVTGAQAHELLDAVLGHGERAVNAEEKTGADVEARLVQLKSLHDKGLISRTEYESHRQAILRDL